MRQQERQRVPPVPAFVGEVDPQAVDRGAELGEPVQPRFRRAPVIIVESVRGEERR